MSKRENEVTASPDALPAFLAGKERGNRGMENVTSEDIIIPRIELIQALSPARDKKDSQYIDGAEEGMLFNNVTRKLYGTEIKVVPVMYVKQYLIWKDRKQGGGKNGFRGAFPTEIAARQHIAELNEQGLDVAETAQHYCLVIDGNRIEEAVVSMSRTKLKVSRRWNSLMRMAGGDCFEREYRLFPVEEANANNEKYYNFNVAMVGFVTQEVYAKAEALYNQVVSGKATVSHDYGDTEATASEEREF